MQILHFTVALRDFLLYILLKFVGDWFEKFELNFSLLFCGIVFLNRCFTTFIYVPIIKTEEGKVFLCHYILKSFYC